MNQHRRIGRGRFAKTAMAATALCLAAGCVSYRARPLNPEQSQAAFNQRSLRDARVLEVARPQLPMPPATAPVSEPATRRASVVWDLESLTRAALYLHPDMEVARAHAVSIRAAETTAGELPNPSFSFAPEYATNAGGLSPWVLGGAFDVPIETAGKRQIRLEEARALTDAARIELTDVAWRVRGRLRDALAEHLLAQDEAALWDREISARTAYLKLLDTRLEAGEAARAEVDVARVDLLVARQARRAADGKRAEAAARLAAAIGITVAWMEGA